MIEGPDSLDGKHHDASKYEKDRGGKGAARRATPFPDAADVAARPVDLSKSYIVRSLNSTTNKALHLGHLRNVVLGAASAGALHALGGRVLRHCVLEDTGRFMMEAMLGVREFERSGASSANLPSKPDHFIGSCYRQYRQKVVGKRGAVMATTGYEARGDAADELIRDVTRGDEMALGLRDRVRAMALDGQQTTLRRIGVSFDCCDYESAEDAMIEGFIADGLARGVFAHNGEGEVVFTASSGRAVRLVNRLGLAEESARLLSFLYRLFGGAPGRSVNVIIAGSEWKGSMSTYAEILYRLGVTQSHEIYAPAFYGMVTLGGKKMASSAGSGVLVDDLLDRLVADERIRDLARRCEGHADVDGLAALVVKCFLLSSPRIESIDFSYERLDDPAVNPGWSIAAAWAALSRSVPPAVALSAASRSVLVDALSLVSFEGAIRHLRRIAGSILDGAARDDSDFRAMAAALSIVPRRSEFAFSQAMPLASRSSAALPAMA